MSYEDEKDKLGQMIDEGYKLWSSGNIYRAIALWRQIILLSDERVKKDAEEIDANLSLRDQFSNILFAAREFDEAMECDEETLTKLESRNELRQTELWNMIKEGVHDRRESLKEMMFGGAADEKRKHEESKKDHRRESSSVPSDTACLVNSSNPILVRNGSRWHDRPCSLEANQPPSPWIKPRINSPQRQAPFPSPESPRMDFPVIQRRPTAPDDPQELMHSPRRSHSVTNLDTHQFTHSGSIGQTTVDDASLPVNNIPRRGQFLGDGIGSDTPGERADRWFRNLEEWTHNFIYGRESRYKDALVSGRRYTKIKIAVLDTGIAHSTREEKSKLQSYRHRIKKMESFLPGENRNAGNIDESGHGTAVACLLLKVCPNAEIYVARVARWTRNGWDIDKDAVAQALMKTVDDKEWKVDIINMSFGWDKDDHEAVRNAISHAKRNKVLMFASTSNYGIGPPNDILYPARSSDVIAIDAADGVGDPASYNPTSEDETGKTRFTALGVAVKYQFSEKRMSGTSFASPIAAGIAALVLEFARQPPLGFDPSVNEHLKMAVGMLLIFRLMSRQKDASKFKFICPWLFLKGDDDEVYGGDGMPGSRRYSIADRIIEVLQKEYGGNIGHKVYLEITREVARSFGKGEEGGEYR